VGLLLLVLALPAAPAAGDGDWEYRGEAGFVHPATGERKTPEEFLRHGEALRKAGRSAEAVRVFDLAARHAPDPALAEAARWELAETRYQAGEFHEAVRAFEDFIARHPQSDRATAAKRRLMESALELAHQGHPEKVLGVPLLSSAKAGIEKLREALRRYPREDFSAEFYQLLGLFYYDRGEYDAAEAEFSTVLEQYPEADVTVPALFHLGLCRLNRFDGLAYDAKPLRDAKRHFDRFVEEADRMSRISARAEGWVRRYLPEARARLARIHELLAEKELQAAEYYRWKGYPHSAAVGYRAVLRAFPDTRAAERARRRLRETGPGDGSAP